MFDVSWSELLILGLVTLIFVGPKELPRFLGTLGRYAGVVRRHANEFRAVFEQAMREAEMEEIKKEVRAVSDGVKASLDGATRSVSDVKAAVKVDPHAERRILPKTAEGVTSASEGVVPEASHQSDIVGAGGPSREGASAAPLAESPDETQTPEPTHAAEPQSQAKGSDTPSPVITSSTTTPRPL